MVKERALKKCWSCRDRGFKYVSSRRALWPFSEHLTLRLRPCLDCNGVALREERGRHGRMGVAVARDGGETGESQVEHG